MTTYGMRSKLRIYRVPGSYVFTPNREDVINSRFRLRYSATCDTYYRDWSDSISLTTSNVMPGWERGIFAMDSVHRKVDEESGEVYFDRVKHNTTGNLKWKFDFSTCGLLVDEVTIRFNYIESHGGEITTTIVGDEGKKRLRYLKGGEYVTYSELQNSSEVAVVIHFIGDTNQVTKLFPQKIMGGIGYPMDIKISLKAPLESLGRPRILFGLMYSNAQEIQVDSRHYKETGSLEPCRGFLHVHFYEGKDLPQQKGKMLETSSKCYLLPSNKKVKCKSVTRKGRNPLWNEQFLIVGVGFLEIKRQALEFCLVSNLKKKTRFIGGFRLSLGYQQIVASQTEKANVVIAKLFSKPVINNDEDGKNESKPPSNGTGSGMKSFTKLAIAMEKKERNGIHHAQINGSVSSKATGSTSTSQSVNPGVDAWKITSMDELRSLDCISAPSTKNISSQQSSLCDSNGITTDTCVTSTTTIVSSKENDNDSFAHAPSLPNVSYAKDAKETQAKERDCVTDALTNENATTEIPEQSDKSNSKDKTSHNGDIAKEETNAKENSEKPWLQRNEPDKHSRNPSLQKKREKPNDTSDRVKDNGREISIIKESKSCEIPDNDETSITCSVALSRRWNSDRQLKKEEKKKGKKTQLERILGEGSVDELTLDSVGLEVKQWENAINRPKQWHYCWQILRRDMIPVHHCKSIKS